VPLPTRLTVATCYDLVSQAWSSRGRMQRRDFTELIAGSAVGWLLAAHAQQPAMLVIEGCE